MIRTSSTWLFAALMLPLLGACQRGDDPTPGASTLEPAQGTVQPAQPAPPASTAPDDDVETGGNSAGISAEAIAKAEARAQSYGAGTDLSEVNAAIERVRRANEALRDGQASKPKPAVTPIPKPSAGLPPAEVKLTGDTIVPSAPELARDVINGIRRVYAAQTGCTVIAGIDTRAVSATGPFNKNAQGKLISGTLIERWSVSGCGKSASYHVVMKVLPDSTVDYAITGA